MLRLAVASDIPRISRSFARAFSDDPMWRWFVPADGFLDRMMAFGDGALRLSLRDQATYTTDDGVAAAVWSPRGRWKASEADAEALAPAFQACFGPNLELFIEGFGLVEAQHPQDLHWYLAGLATHPDWQRQGIASALMQPILERCDSESIPAYLEASNAHNVPFYGRHGFEVTGTVELPGGGPTVYLMWRKPKHMAK